MDRFLIDYLQSGKAWVLVGSGPSVEMGYPSWSKLAEVAIATVKAECPGQSIKGLEATFRSEDFPGTFEGAQQILGAQNLIHALQAKLNPSRSAEIYNLICRWPVPVYLTTNYDDELHRQLGILGETYLPYTNSEAHMAHLLPDLQGAIFKLHGDLRSDSGLILTRSQYSAIQSDSSWQYWRTKMTSIFQMTRVVVVGHSLLDPNFQHILQAAKQGAGVQWPICWIAPDIKFDKASKFLEEFRIRVISYDNRDGDHANLCRLLQQITAFIPSRTSVCISDKGKRIVEQAGSAAPAFFVFNRLLMQTDYEEKRRDVLVAAIESAAPMLAEIPAFTVKKALELVGWPSDVLLPSDVEADIGTLAVERGLLAKQGDAYVLTERGLEISNAHRQAFQHIRDRFHDAVVRGIRADFTGVSAERADKLAGDIEAALTGYFKGGGFTLASLLFKSDSASKQLVVPPSVLPFMNDAAAQYGDLLDRQVFLTTSLRIFTRAGSAEKDYLGRLAQGFFGFHALGAFGDIALEKMRHAKATMWLFDSNVQIALLAIGSTTSDVWQECVKRLAVSQIRLLTLDRLFDETRGHWVFADKMVREHGPTSHMVVAAARGEAPFRRSNLFLEGFVRWQAAGNPADWESYMFHVFGTRNPTVEDIRRRLVKKGIEILSFSDWPGFNDKDYAVRDEYADQIAHLRMRRDYVPDSSSDEEHLRDPYRKAGPEAEALVVVQRERQGDYHILSGRGVASPAWFISDTSILNAIEKGGLRVTWQPEGFLRFAATLSTAEGSVAAEQAFDTLLWGLAQTGLSLLDKKTAENVLGNVIDQATVTIEEMRQMYEATIAEKYSSESISSVLAKIDPIDRPLAALQLANEIGQVEAFRRARAETLAEEERRRAVIAEDKLKEVEQFRLKMEDKKARGRRKAHKQKAKSQRKRK